MLSAEFIQEVVNGRFEAEINQAGREKSWDRRRAPSIMS